MKPIFPILIVLLILYSCGKSGFLKNRKEQNMYGEWELTRYEVNNVDVFSSTTLTRKKLILRDGEYLTPMYSSSGGKYCGDSITIFNVTFSVNDNTLSFDESGYCSDLDGIDPIYYLNNSMIENTWDIKHFTRKSLVITNELTERDQEIKIVFEKKKNINYDK